MWPWEKKKSYAKVSLISSCHYHKLWFMAAVARLQRNMIIQSRVHNILTCIIRISLKRQYYVKCSDIGRCFYSVLDSESGMGSNGLSLFILPLDLFWTVMKVHLHLRISIMIWLRYTVYEAHGLAWAYQRSLIKFVKTWIYSKACMINEGEDLIPHLSRCHNFTSHSLALMGE